MKEGKEALVREDSRGVVDRLDVYRAPVVVRSVRCTDTLEA